MIRISTGVHSSRAHSDPYMPTPEAIRRETAAIQRGWSEETRQKRAGRVEHLVALYELISTPVRRGYTVET